MADRLGDYTARYLGRVTLNPIPHIDPIGTILFPLLQFFTHFPLIGWAKPVPINSAHLRNPHRDRMFISLAGPASNLLAACVAFCLLHVLKLVSRFIGIGMLSKGSIWEPVLLIIFWAVMINVLLAFFNLIPIPPLDGHWILYGILPPRAAAVLERMGSYGFLILYALMFLGAFSVVLNPVVRLVMALMPAF